MAVGIYKIHRPLLSKEPLYSEDISIYKKSLMPHKLSINFDAEHF